MEIPHARDVQTGINYTIYENVFPYMESSPYLVNWSQAPHVQSNRQLC